MAAPQAGSGEYLTILIMANSTESQNKGPRSYQCCVRFHKQEAITGGAEYQLFTDARIVDDLDAGPFKFINTVALASSKTIVPAIVLRTVEYFEKYEEMKDDLSTNVDNYHGGFLQDEVAALLSLLLGCRIKSGGLSRRFHPELDPIGRPIAIELSRDPILPPILRGDKKNSSSSCRKGFKTGSVDRYAA